MPTKDAPKFIRLNERDTFHSLDSDGAGTLTGRTWLVNAAAIVAVVCDENRRNATHVILAGQDELLPVCDSVDWIEAVLNGEDAGPGLQVCWICGKVGEWLTGECGACHEYRAMAECDL